MSEPRDFSQPEREPEREPQPESARESAHDSANDASFDESLPPRVVEQLTEASRHRLFVPDDVDRAVLAAAEQHLAPVRRRHHWRRFAASSGAVAAAVAIGLSIWLAMPGSHGTAPHAGSPHVAASGPEDIDGNGEINVLDAFALARRLKASDAPPVELGDVNGDGRVDQADVEAIARRAVQLNGGHG